jgi:zinc protease
VRDKLPAALDLGLEMLTSPAFSEKELDVLESEYTGTLEASLHEPEQVAGQTVEQIVQPWPKEDPRHVPTSAEHLEQIKGVKAADARAFYKQFVGAGHAELVVVGDFEPAVVTDKVEKALGSWGAKAPYTRLASKAFGVAGLQKSVDIKDKENSVLIAMEDLPLRDTDADYPAFMIAGQVLGASTGSRLWMRVREKEGLSYGVQGFTQADAFDQVGLFGVFAIVAPQNLAKAKASILDEVGKMTTGKIEADELARSKDEWIKSIDTQLSSDAFVVELLQHELYRERAASHLIELRKKVQALTADDVEKAAKKYFKVDRLVVVDAGDTSKAK